MAKVLLYNLTPSKAAQLKMLCRRIFVEATEVERSDFGKPIASLLDGSAASLPAQPADFDGEMLYFAEMDGGMLNILLDQIKRKKLGVALKAVQTETNTAFTSQQLYCELCAEREAISKSISANN